MEPTTAGGCVTIDRVAAHAGEGIATIVLSHPGKLNALSVRMWRELHACVSQLAADDEVRAIVVRGADGHFAAGADIEEFPVERGTEAALRHYHNDIIAPALDALAGCRHPTVALIEGVCVGGGLEIAAHCDLRIAGEASRFGIPINQLGFSMAPGELRGVLGLVGRAVALELLLEGRIFGAHEAREKGLLTRVTRERDAAAEAYAAARRIAAGAPLAARINKMLIRRMTPQAEPLTESEWVAAFAYWDSHDHREGVAAFLEKRVPNFRGH